MSLLVRMKPRSTVLFENEQKSRFAPNAVDIGVPAAGLAGVITLSPDGTDVQDAGVATERRMGRPVRALYVLDDRAVVNNGAYVLENDGIINPPSKLGLVLIDVDDSITNYVVTVDGKDELGGTVQEQFTFPGPGKVRFTASLFSEVTGVSGGVVTGTFAGDLLRLAPGLGPLPHEVLQAHGPFFTDAVVEDDPNQTGGGVGGNDNGAYVTAQDAADKNAFVTVPDLPEGVIAVEQVTVEFNTKNVGAPLTGGCQFYLRIDADEYFLGDNTTAGADAGPGDPKLFAFPTVPGRGTPWTIAEFNAARWGVRFKGESPTIEKRWLRLRLEADVRSAGVGPLVSSSDPRTAMLQAVSGDPFDETGEDASYVTHYGEQADRAQFEYPPLPPEATGVKNVKVFWRAAAVHLGLPNGTTERTQPCTDAGPAAAIVPSVQPRGGTGLNAGFGPLEQGNLGGWRPGVTAPGGALEYFGLPDAAGSANGGDDRILNGPGNPSGSGCGFVSAPQDGQNVPWGTPVSQSVVLNDLPGATASPWTVAAFNAIETVFELGSFGHLFRWIKTYVEPEWTRDPTGDTFFHLVVDDDPSAANDAELMVSQHPLNKRFGVDFAGIPEVTRVNFVRGVVRAFKSSSAVRGWKIKLQVQGVVYDPPAGQDLEHTNTTPEDREVTWLVSPATGAPFTRDEVNSAVLIWEAQGENAFAPKTVTNMALFADVEPIPEKIDTARRLASELLHFLGRPIPLLRVTVPFELGDARLMRDIAVSHDAIPRVAKTLGFERWDRSLMRVFTKELEPETDTWTLLLFDLRDFLLLFFFSGQATTKGRSFDGMSIISPGANVQFVRATNDYQPDPFADIIQELTADEPPVDDTGILVQNSGINRVVNSAFSEGAANVFDGWVKVGDTAPGASIVQDAKSIYDPASGVLRSVLYTGANAPSDVYLERDIVLPTGEGLVPEGSRHVLTITHEDVSGHPLSVWLRGKPVGFGETNFNPFDQSWSAANPSWFTLPVRSKPTRDRIIGDLPTLHDVGQTVGFRDTLRIAWRIGVRTAANQQNRLFDVQSEGGTIASGAERSFPSTRILTKTGPVVRDAGQLFVENRISSPVYWLKRGTAFCVIETLWDSAELPVAAGARRYVYGMVVNAFNREALYYDADTESFVYERVLAGVSFKATRFFPAISAGIPIRLATRWVSNESDLGEAAFSIHLFVNDTRGADAAPPGSPVQPSSAKLYLGSLDGSDGQMLDGRIRRFRVTQQVLSLDRIKKLR